MHKNSWLPEYPILTSFILSCVMLSSYMYNLIATPAFWGEDGSHLYADLLCEGGVLNLFKPIVSSVVILERLYAYIIVQVFHSIAPQLFAIVPTVICIAIFSFFSSTRFEWLVRSHKLRIMLSLLLAVSTSNIEVRSSLIGLTYTLTWALLLTLISRPLPPLPIFIILWIVLPLSAHTAVTLLPLALILYLSSRKIHYLIATLMCSVDFVVHLLLGVNSVLIESTPDFSRISLLPFLVIDNFAFYGLSVVFLGYDIASSVIAEASTYLGVSIVLLVSFFYIQYGAMKSEKRDTMIGMLFIPILYTLLHSIARPAIAQSPFYSEFPLVALRHEFFFYSTVLAALFIALDSNIYRENKFNIVYIMNILLVILATKSQVQGFLIAGNSPRMPNAIFDQSWVNLRNFNNDDNLSKTFKLPILPLVFSNHNKLVPWAEVVISKSGGHKKCVIEGGNR